MDLSRNLPEHGESLSINSPSFTLKLTPGAGAKLTLKVKRYSEKPIEVFPEAIRPSVPNRGKTLREKR